MAERLRRETRNLMGSPAQTWFLVTIISILSIDPSSSRSHKQKAYNRSLHKRASGDQITSVVSQSRWSPCLRPVMIDLVTNLELDVVWLRGSTPVKGSSALWCVKVKGEERRNWQTRVCGFARTFRDSLLMDPSLSGMPPFPRRSSHPVRLCASLYRSALRSCQRSSAVTWSKHLFSSRTSTRSDMPLSGGLCVDSKLFAPGSTSDFLDDFVKGEGLWTGSYLNGNTLL
ncbi:hypothetical protein B0O80DRAFT_512957 [Mortierella sp. GBAus27b]|nr:hypothetical protein B0O80DRAFT_512957 [Mortierella sp. GBAus27b]